jgi:two-component system chemotaxis response regulator CheB
MKKIRVLVIDDSALVRTILRDGLNRYEDLLVVDVARDPYEARDKIVRLQPDVLTLDVEMPRMDGVEFLKKLMPQYPLPVVMVSSLTQRGKQVTLDALAAGAVDFIAKPTSGLAGGLTAMIGELVEKIRIASCASVAHLKRNGAPVQRGCVSTVPGAVPEWGGKIVAIGASTGGVEALHRVVSSFPANMAGTVIVQHMPAGFTAMFSDRLNEVSAVEVREAGAGDRLRNGLVLIAPGDKHLQVVKLDGSYVVKLSDGEKVKGHRPSVDVMMKSVAASAGAASAGAVLTGMGSDGADGLAAMRRAGARTIAQDEQTSVVFGMPREAFARGGAEKLVPLDNITSALIASIRRGAHG